MSWAATQALTTPIKVVTALARVLEAFYQNSMAQGDTNPAKQLVLWSQQDPTQNKRVRMCERESGTTTLLVAPLQAWAWATQMGMREYAGQTTMDTTTSTATESAVKHDKVDVPVHLWDNQIAFLLNLSKLTEAHRKAFNLLRQTMPRRWQRNMATSWKQWWLTNQYTIQQKRTRPLRTNTNSRNRGLSACLSR
ncbi:hypothetical protein ACA910_002294 [Epithemia clementina (nom. ined.)]